MVVCRWQAPFDQHRLCNQYHSNDQRDSKVVIASSVGKSSCQTLQNGSLAVTCSRDSVAGSLLCSSTAGAISVEGGRGSVQGQQHLLPKAAHACKVAQKTLLLAYLPRCANEDDVQSAFAAAGITANCFVSIMREGSQSKCFGFVRFPTCDAAKAAMLACSNGTMVIKDRESKAWHVKASWARSELKDVKKVKQHCSSAKPNGM